MRQLSREYPICTVNNLLLETGKTDTSELFSVTTMAERQSIQTLLKLAATRICAIGQSAFNLSGVLLRGLVNNTTRIFHGLMSLLLLITILLVVIEIFRDSEITVEPILMPQELVGLGYTPTVAARRLTDSSNRFHIRPLIPMEYRTLADPPRQVDFVVPSVGISVKSIANYFRDVLRLGASTVTGEMLFHRTEERISLRLRLDSNVIFDSSARYGETGMQELFISAGYELTRRLNPFVLALYHYSRNEDLEASHLVNDLLHNSSTPEVVAAALNLQGFIHADNREYEKSYRQFERAIEIYPNSSTTYSNWCGVLAQAGEVTGSIAPCYTALELSPRDAQAHINLGAALLHLKPPNVNQAIEHFKQATDLDPNKASAYINWGIALMATRDADAAIERFAAALKIEPANAKAYLNWGTALSQKDNPDWDGAIEQYRKAIGVDPNYSEAYRNLGVALQNKPSPDWDASIPQFRKAIETDPKNTAAYNNLGVTFMYQQDPDWNEAIIQFIKVIEIDPDDASVYYNLGTSIINLEDPDWDEAVQHFSKSIELEPDYARAYNNWGFVLYARDNQDLNGAIDLFYRALDLDQTNVQAYQNLGSALADRGDCADAAEIFNAATQIDGRTREFVCPSAL